ncbi:MAG: FAD-dependent oxidoreductase, partial [Burkholderiales bacterium]
MDITSTRAGGIQAARLDPSDYARNFADSHPPLTRAQALIEAERCYYCHDAPCVAACPTGIDVPTFIQRIAQDNDRGAAKAILQANPLGGMCARACPTEVLCEQACVRNHNESKPVEIGRLQRYATDALFAKPGAPLFTRAARTGRQVAVVGAGPAGLACAHGLARQGHDIALFDARPKAGGLNEYGIATYKTTGGTRLGDAQRIDARQPHTEKHGVVLFQQTVEREITAERTAGVQRDAADRQQPVNLFGREAAGGLVGGN